MTSPTSSFSVSRVNNTTFVITEDDKYGERPQIYAKLHPRAPILILNDTGCNAPRPEHKHADITRLRLFLETFPVPENDDKPLNVGGERDYLIILSHCHYDHIGGIAQFLRGGCAEVVASAAGRDFIESDLPAHSLCRHNKITTPPLNVTHWAQSNEKLTWPLLSAMPGDDMWERADHAKLVDLALLMLQTPGHTPCSLSWYDIDENTIYVGDSMYRLGPERQPIIFPPQGDLVEWIFSVQKVEAFIDAHNAAVEREDGEWLEIKQEMKLCASHETCNVPAKAFIQQTQSWFGKLIAPERKPVMSMERFGETFDYYLSNIEKEGWDEGMAMLLPRRLVDNANAWYGHA